MITIIKNCIFCGDMAVTLQGDCLNCKDDIVFPEEKPVYAEKKWIFWYRKGRNGEGGDRLEHDSYTRHIPFFVNPVSGYLVTDRELNVLQDCRMDGELKIHTVSLDELRDIDETIPGFVAYGNRYMAVDGRVIDMETKKAVDWYFPGIR